MSVQIDNVKMWESMIRHYRNGMLCIDRCIDLSLQDQGLAVTGDDKIISIKKQERFILEDGSKYVCIKNWCNPEMYSVGNVYTAVYNPHIEMVCLMSGDGNAYPWNDKEVFDDYFRPATEEPKFKVGDMVVSTKNPSLTYKVLKVGLTNELGKLDYEVEIFTDGKAGIKIGNTFKEHNIHLISCEKMDEWGKLILVEPVSDDLEEAAKNHAYSCHTSKATGERIAACIYDFKAGAQWQKKQNIDKACEWLTANLANYFGHESAYTYVDDFRKALEEG